MARIGGSRAGMTAAIALVSSLVVIVGVLSFAAYQRVNSTGSPGAAKPAPTFTLGVRSSTPIAPPATPATAPGMERLLAVGSEQWWRATAGRCGGAAPLIERSSDGGATWTDVTPRYLGVAQVQTLVAFSPADVEVVAAVAGCDAQSLRSYTRGEFWESYPDVLVASRYVDVGDPATVHLPSGPVAAPCARAFGLQAAGDSVALQCDSAAWSWTGAEWQRLPADNALALAFDDGDVVIAHTDGTCEGIALSRVNLGSPETASLIGCAAGADASAPTAIDVEGDDVIVWSGEEVVRAS
jgi:hypothetical protein